MTEEYVNQFIKSQRAKFQYIDIIPEKPLEWMRESLEESEAAFLGVILFYLVNRGACAADCARFAIGPVDLPFEGPERRVLEVVVSDLRARGIEPLNIAQIIELSCALIEALKCFPNIPRVAHA